jgi:DNA topoisomerase IA
MSFIKVLMVAEKPSIAEVLARSLSGGRSFKGDSRIPSHEYRGTFLGQDAAFTVTSVMGHVFRRVVQSLKIPPHCFRTNFPVRSIDFEPKWNRNWDEINPEDLCVTPPTY